MSEEIAAVLWEKPENTKFLTQQVGIEDVIVIEQDSTGRQSTKLAV